MRYLVHISDRPDEPLPPAEALPAIDANLPEVAVIAAVQAKLLKLPDTRTAFIVVLAADPPSVGAIVGRFCVPTSFFEGWLRQSA